MIKQLTAIKRMLGLLISPHVKSSFLQNKTITHDSKILDIGCGNKSVIEIKKFLPDCDYTGIDVVDLNQDEFSKSLMEEYYISSPENFVDTIKNFGPVFDLVLSAHNIEHCDRPDETLVAMLEAVKDEGYLYMSFPSEKSINFPSRRGTLNFFDDDTHNDKPPVYDNIIKIIKDNGFEITYQSREYKPFFSYLIGFFNEPLSIIKKKVLKGTWEYYGFQSIIHAKKIR